MEASLDPIKRRRRHRKGMINRWRGYPRTTRRDFGIGDCSDSLS